MTRTTERSLTEPNTKKPEDLLPMKSRDFQIILLLLEEERHGYGIVKELARRKPPGLSLFPASLYRALRRMEADGLIASEPRSTGPDRESMYFHVTSFGRRVAHLEARRLDELLGAARSVRLLGASDGGSGGGSP